MPFVALGIDRNGPGAQAPGLFESGFLGGLLAGRELVGVFGGLVAGFPGGLVGVRIEFEGKIYTGSFQLEADQGNKGRSGRDQHHFWSAIDIPAILKLRTAEP